MVSLERPNTLPWTGGSVRSGQPTAKPSSPPSSISCFQQQHKGMQGGFVGAHWVCCTGKALRLQLPAPTTSCGVLLTPQGPHHYMSEAPQTAPCPRRMPPSYPEHCHASGSKQDKGLHLELGRHTSLSQVLHRHDRPGSLPLRPGIVMCNHLWTLCLSLSDKIRSGEEEVQVRASVRL